MDTTAYLSNIKDVTYFIYNGIVVRFKAPYSLQYYEEIKKWNNGYIEVMTKYNNSDDLEEEYIDLIPILKNLYIDPKEFLKSIERVEVRYDKS